ncbi:MMPL family transporter [Conexibacter sp. SYSU D00693]|uniref:MMPL family transporter n=1 Tax=Conexibacter sp. SYSU D00693 TaxID=2812560 RepID=UPI00196B9976|nr:MMPL family transporter [Conexibacter sp. SYSU D00693]
MPPARRLHHRPDPGCAPPDDVGWLAGGVRRAAGAAARFPKSVVLLWLVLIAGCIMAGSLTGTKELSDVDAGTGDSGRATQLVHAAGLRDAATENVVVRSDSAAKTTAAVQQLRARVAGLPEVARVQAPAQTKDGGRIALVNVTLRGDPDDAADHVEGVQAAVESVDAGAPGVTLQQAGAGSVEKALDELISDDLAQAEMFSLPITLIVLVFAFGAVVAAFVPLLLGLTAVAGAMGAMGVVSQLAPSTDNTAATVVLIGLAVGVDYSLFYVRREREERRRGRGPLAALDAAAASVGRAILVSGLTVMVALAGLLLSGEPVFASIALATILVVLIAVIGSLTVLPAVLALMGDRIERGRLPFARRREARRARREASGHRGFWGALAGGVTARPVASMVTAVCVLGALAVPATQMKLAFAGNGALPDELPAVAALHTIERTFPGAPGDVELVVSAAGLNQPGAQAKLAALGERALRVTGGAGEPEVQVSRDGGTALVSVPMPDEGRDAGDDVVRELRSTVTPTAATVAPGAEALVGGQPAEDLDGDEALASATPLVVGFVLALALLLLLGAFRSPKLALAVIGLNLLSVGAAAGVLVAVFQETWAEGLLDFESTGAIATWLPLFGFTVLFGLSMDYTVLVLERIRELRRSGLSPAEAAAQGVAATGSTVTSAALVMVGVFSVFATLTLIDMKQMGVGLAAAVLIDATIVRGVALPAAVTLLGEKGWKVPRRRVRPASAGVGAGWDDGRAVAATTGSDDGR